VSLLRNYIVGSCSRRRGRGNRSMNQQLRTVTVRIANTADGGVRAWSDDLVGLTLTCPNHETLFAELTPRISTILQQQGFASKLVREIHQFIFEVEKI